MDLALSRDRIEASPTSRTSLEVILKDKYNNTVFTDNETNLSLEIPDQSKAIIRSISASEQVVSGKAQFQIEATDIP